MLLGIASIPFSCAFRPWNRSVSNDRSLCAVGPHAPSCVLMNSKVVVEFGVRLQNTLRSLLYLSHITVRDVLVSFEHLNCPLTVVHLASLRFVINFPTAVVVLQVTVVCYKVSMSLSARSASRKVVTIVFC
jgi:hypothetical protein